MDAAFDRAGSERSVHAEAFAGGAEQRQEEDRQGVEQQQTVAPLRIADAQDAQAHAETQILGVAEPRLDRPPFGVEVDVWEALAVASLAARCQASFIPLAWTQTAAPTLWRAAVSSAGQKAGVPLLLTQSTARRVSPSAAVT